MNKRILKTESGQTMVEMVIFIVIIGIVITGAMSAFKTVLSFSGQSGHLLTASQLANARMNLITQNRHEPDEATGFANLSDPCNSGSLDACVSLNAFASAYGYVITSSPNPIDAAADGSKTVTVTVTGTGNATTSARFTQ